MQWKYQIKNITQKLYFKLCKVKAITSFLTLIQKAACEGSHIQKKRKKEAH